jgi:SpoVK/Ycf46/Vps4 family AAA+-type ATPase
MDSAFERRFIYKIEFEKPEINTRKAIWQSLVSGISESDAQSLASRFDFSGGQIENIARKATVHRVLSGKTPALDDFVRFSQEESHDTQSERRVGFVA